MCTLRNLLKTAFKQRHKHARNLHMIARLAQSRILALAKNIQCSWYISDGYLFRVFLNFQLLKFDKLGAARLQAQSTTRLVHLTILRLTHLEWHERCGVAEWLIGLGTASIARVCGNLQQRLDLGGSNDHALDRDQVTNRARFYLSYGEWLRLRAKVDLVAAQKFGREAVFGIARRVCCVQVLLGKQTMLNVNVQGVFVNRLG